MNNIMHLLDVVDKVRDSVALGLMSDPGLSKTSQVKQWAGHNDRRYCELIISQRMPSEISGMPMPVPETKKMEVFDFDTLLQLEDGDVLAFDEFTNGNIQTLNACLTLIQERTMLSGKKLPSLVIVAMGNPQGKCDLLPQTKQRFWWVDVKWDAQSWTIYMEKQWGFRPDSTLVKAITQQYQDGFKMTQYNYMTPRTMENLVKIATVVPQTDMFWTASKVDPKIVEAIYKSFENTSTFFSLRQKISHFVIMNPDIDVLVRIGLSQYKNMRELQKFIIKIEETGIAPELIEYLKRDDQACVCGEGDE